MITASERVITMDRNERSRSPGTRNGSERFEDRVDCFKPGRTDIRSAVPYEIKTKVDCASPIVRKASGTTTAAFDATPQPVRRFLKDDARLERFPDALDADRSARFGVEVPAGSEVELVRPWPVGRNRNCNSAVVRVIDSADAISKGTLMLVEQKLLVEAPPSGLTARARVAQKAADAEKSKRAATDTAQRLFEDAQADVKAKRGADALSKLDACLKELPSHEQCLALRASVAVEQLRRYAEAARSQLAAKKIWEAQVEVQKCLSIEPSNAACLKLKPSIEGALARILPHHLKDTALYDEGGTFVAYFSLVNASGDFVAAAGKVIISIAADSGGFTATDVAVGRFDVLPSDFKRVTLGKGAFARSALVWQRYLSQEEVYGKFSFGRAELHSLESSNMSLYVQYRFKDATGRELAVAREPFDLP